MQRPWTPLGLATLALAVGTLGLAGAADAGDATVGKTLYTTNCTACHGDSGKGDGPVGVALVPRPRDFSQGSFQFDADKDGKTGTDADLAAVMKNGAASYGGSPLMAPWAHLGDKAIQDLIAHIRTLHN